jgi:RNA polymerase sigma factor (sigma-70 family)
MSSRSEHGSAQGKRDPSAIIGEQRQLTNLAYRLLGSLDDAEDVVQETFARWYAMAPQQRDAIGSPGGWLNRVASRICLDVLGSARVRRERYVGEWLPEPLRDPAEWSEGRPAGASDPADQVTLDESVGMAFLVVLESMTPAERVAFILHDVFGYLFAEVAGIMERSPGACRQLASSARNRLRGLQVSRAPTEHHAGIVRAWRHAWQAGDIGALIGLLAPDATATGDGGGRSNAELRPIVGADQIARFYADHRATGLTILERRVNGQPGLVAQRDDIIVTVIAFGIAGDRIMRIWAVLNPDKLRRWTKGSSSPAVNGGSAG